MKAKILALLLIMCMAVGLVAACGGSDDPAPATPPPADTSSSDTTSADDSSSGGDDSAPAGSGDGLRDVTVRYQLISWGGPGDAKMAEWSEKTNAVLADLGKPYKIDFYIQEGGDYTDKTNLMLASGANEFDIIFISNWAADYPANAAAGYLTELDPYLEKYPEIEQILTTPFMRGSNINGKQYALPVNKEKARQIGWVLRQDIADEIGMDIDAIKALPYDQRMDAIEPYFYKAGELGYWVNPEGLWDYQYGRVHEPIIGAPGFYDTDGKIVAIDLTDRYIAATKKISQWHADGLINPNKTNQDSGDSEFTAGYTFAGIYQLKPGKDKELQGVIPFPLVQIEMNPHEIDTAEITGAMSAIPIGAANKDEAFDFLYLLYTEPRVMNTVIFGEEGVEYNVNPDGRISFTGEWVYGHSWTIGDQYKSLLNDGEDLDKWEQFDAFDAQGVTLPMAGFLAINDLDMDTWLAGMTAVREQYRDLFRGYYPVDQVDAKFAELRADYETAGMNELIAAIQAQADAWLASR